jgi:N-acetylglucosamine kinase-like BadF-type ATPase
MRVGEERKPTRRKRRGEVRVPGLVLGIDGGQTATTAAICAISGRLLGLGRAGPADHVWEPGGVERARRAVIRSIAQAWRQAKLEPSRFEAAFLGMTGGDERTTRAIRESILTKRFQLENDSVSALACVTAGRPGVVVIAGTGTIAYGRNARGGAANASGWGYLLGDEGGGFWIARQAIAAACKAHDGRAPQTALTPLLLEAAGVRDAWELHGLIYSKRMSRAAMAALAAVVPVAAKAGDPAARRILAEAGRELGLSAGVVAEKLGMHRGGVTVGIVGGVFRGSDEVKRSFMREVRRRASKAIFAEPRFAPVIACVLLALRMAGARLSPRVMENLEAASTVLGAK